MKENESETDYVRRLADELDTEFQRVGPDTVCAFIAEPVVGAVRDSPWSMPVPVLHAESNDNSLLHRLSAPSLR